MIPTFLIVNGLFLIFKIISSIVSSVKGHKDEEEKQVGCDPYPHDALFNLILVIWFIAGKLLHGSYRYSYIKYNDFSMTFTQHILALLSVSEI